MLGLPLIGFPVFAGLMWIIERWIMRQSVEKFVAQEKPGKGLLGTHTLTLDAAGVLEKTDVGESRTLWSGIDRVEDDADYAFIYTSAAAAHVVPLRAFASAGDARSFVEFARSRSLTSQSQEVSTSESRP